MTAGPMDQIAQRSRSCVFTLFQRCCCAKYSCNRGYNKQMPFKYLIPTCIVTKIVVTWCFYVSAAF